MRGKVMRGIIFTEKLICHFLYLSTMPKNVFQILSVTSRLTIEISLIIIIISLN